MEATTNTMLRNSKLHILSFLFISLQPTSVFADGTMTDLGIFFGKKYSIASGVNADGSVVVGTFNNTNNDNQAFIRTPAIAMIQGLGRLPGGLQSYAHGVNADGSVVVGQVYSENHKQRASRWTQTGMADLGTLGGQYSTAYGVSADGSIVIGLADTAANQYRAFRWTQAGMVDLGTLGGKHSVAYGVSANGSVVVGWAYTADNQQQAFRWTQVTGMVDLGTLGGKHSVAYGVNADGSVVVGCAYTADNQQQAFRWNEVTGIQSVEDWLRNNGVNITTALPSIAHAVNADGSIVVGTLTNGQAFIARVISPTRLGLATNPNVPPALVSGLITLQNTLASLATVTQAPPPFPAAEDAQLILHGSHSHPLNSRLQDKKQGFWASGDWGSKTQVRNGIAEVGLARILYSTWQGSLALGRTARTQTLDFNGKQNFHGNYFLTEVMGELPIKNLWLTVDGLLHCGNVINRRGYTNAGILDGSLGKTHSASKAFKARIDWDEFLKFKILSFAPYGEYVVNFAQQKPYSEKDGSFPAFFDAKKQCIREARGGVNSELVLIKNISILGTLEKIHRFEGSAPNSTGQVFGLFGFNIPGKAYKKNWLRGSIGIKGSMGSGAAVLSINATSVGEDDRMWIGTFYQLNF